jgi:hypothetical protein
MQKMRLRKKYITITALLLSNLLLIVSEGVSFTPKAALVKATQPSDFETKRLFRDMNIIRIPRIAPPVEISLMDIYDKQVTLVDFKGKIVFLNFLVSRMPY